MSCVAFVWRKRCPWLIVGWFWFICTLIPVIGLVQVGNQAMADRYSYIPSIGLCMAVVWCVSNWLSRHRLGKVVRATLVAVAPFCCLALTRIQLSYSCDSIELMARAVAVTGAKCFRTT